MPQALLPVADPTTQSLTLAAGVELVADVYRPAGSARYPVLLMRQPYGRAIASTLVVAHPAWYAAHGYIVVIQDVRGRGDSTGLFRLFESDADDGAATLAWAAGLAGCDGRVATYGFSYQAVTQFLALAGANRAGTKRPDAIVPAMGGWTLRDDWAYAGGAFCLSGNIGWACQMGAEAARLADDAEAFAALASAARGTPWSGPRPADPDVLRKYGHYTHYAAWLADEPSTWTATSPAQALAGQTIDIPGLHIGGWQDTMLDGTLGAYEACRDGRATQRLIVGPWMHSPWGRRVGALDLGPDAVSRIDLKTVAFLDHELKQRELDDPKVCLFDVGARAWVGFDEWPTPVSTALYLASDGRAATASTGQLVVGPEAEERDMLVHDPWRPAPIIGGAWGAPGGYQDRAPLDDRADVAVYTSKPRTRTCRLAGCVSAEIFVSTAQPSHDLHATLSVVEPDGRAMTLTAGHLRVVDTAVPGMRRVSMRSVCTTLHPGQAIRLSLQSAAWPAFVVNPGTGERAESAQIRDAKITTLALCHGALTPSRLLLPIADW